MIIHYKQGTTDFLGMNNIITPLVVYTEIERVINSIFNAELLVIKDTEMKYEEIKVLDFIKIPTPGGDQLFRVIDKDDTATHTVTLFCRHILFDLQKRLIKDTFIQQRNGTQALQQILNNLDEPTAFTAFSDITTLNNLRLVRTKGIDAILGGNKDNYLIERYNGEIDVDNYKIKLLKRLGTDRGYEIREGKNLTGYDYKEDSSKLCTRLMPVLFDGTLLPEVYVNSELISKYDMVHTNTIKFDDIKLKERLEDGTIKPDNPEEDYVNEGYNTENDMFIEARKRCNELFQEGLDKVRVQAAVKFIDLSKTEQYKNFEFLHRLDLGDTVHFILEKYNLRVAERIVSYRYNALTKEYIELELGHAQDSIFSSGGGLNGGSSPGEVGSGDGAGDTNLGVEFDKWYDKVITDVTNQITGGMKDSYVLVRENEILIMDTKDISTAQKVWRWNNAGLGFSSNGYNGTYTTAMTANGQFVINEITCRKFTGDLIEANSIQANRLSVEAKGEITEGLVTQSSLNVSLDGVKLEASKSGGGNLVDNSGFNAGRVGWADFDYAWENRAIGREIWDDSNEWILQGTKAICIFCKGYEADGEVGIEQIIPVKQNQNYTLTALMARHRADGGVHVYDTHNWEWLGNDHVLESEPYNAGKDSKAWKLVKVTFNSGSRNYVGVRFKMTKSTNDGHIWVCQPMMNEGTLAQPWSEKTMDASNVVSSINVSPEGVKIKAKKIQLEGATTVGTGGRQVKVNNGDYSAIIDGQERMFMGSRDFENNYRVPKFYMGAYGFNANEHNYFGMTAYRGNNDNPEGNGYAYQDLSYRCINSNFRDWSNIKMYSSGRIRVAPAENFEITTNYLKGVYAGIEERRLALFATSTNAYFNSNLQIGCIRNFNNVYGMIIADDSVAGAETRVRCHTDSNRQKFFRVCDNVGDIGLGSTSFPWKNVVAKTNLVVDNLIVNPTKTSIMTTENALDNINFIQSMDINSAIKMDISKIVGSNYAPKVIDGENSDVAIDTVELLKLALMEIKKLKQEIQNLKVTNDDKEVIKK